MIFTKFYQNPRTLPNEKKKKSRYFSAKKSQKGAQAAEESNPAAFTKE